MKQLFKDLKARGLLDETLVMWMSKFGRTPDNNYCGGVASSGRGYNANESNVLAAGSHHYVIT